MNGDSKQISVGQQTIRIMNGIHRKGQRSFKKIEERPCIRSCAQYKSTYTLYSRLMIRLVDLYN